MTTLREKMKDLTPTELVRLIFISGGIEPGVRKWIRADQGEVIPVLRPEGNGYRADGISGGEDIRSDGMRNRSREAESSKGTEISDPVASARRIQDAEREASL